MPKTTLNQTISFPEKKKKAKDRGSHARALRKELTRIKADRNIKQKKINELEEKLKSQSAQTSIDKPDKVTLVYITLSFPVYFAKQHSVHQKYNYVIGIVDKQKSPCRFKKPTQTITELKQPIKISVCGEKKHISVFTPPSEAERIVAGTQRR